MKRYLAIVVLLGSGLVVTRALAQQPGGFPGLTPGGFQGGGGFPGAGGFPSGGGLPGGGGFPGFGPGGGTQLGQQPGIVPGRGGAFLAPGRSLRLALYCADLFAATPDHRTRMTAPGDGGEVRRADGSSTSLRDALEAGRLLIRGRGPGDAPRMDGRAGFDVYLTNWSGEALAVDLPSGLVLVPAGQTPPPLPSGLDRVLGVAASTRRHEGDAVAYAVWASRGSTRVDVEQTTMRRVTDGEARQVQRWLDAASLPQRFDRETDVYDRLYERAVAGLSDAQTLAGTASLASGGTVRVSGHHTPDGQAVVTLTAPRGGVFRYTARVDGSRNGKIGLLLTHLKTGCPIEANGGRIWVAPDTTTAAR